MRTGKVIEMEYWFWPILRLLAGLITVLGSGGIRAVLAENLILKQQLLVMRRPRRRAPNLRTADRVLFGFCSQFLSPRRLLRTAIILKPATLLRFHRGFKDFYYGGLIRSRRVARMAEQTGLATTVHLSGGFGFVYSLHFASCTPKIGPWQEYKKGVENYGKWFAPPLRIVDGAITIPQGPGVGLADPTEVLKGATLVADGSNKA
jgi:hypothetical protein